MQSICIICNKPNPVLIEFYRKFVIYDIYLIIDDNTTEYKSEYENVKYVQINNIHCTNYGIQNLSTITLRKPVSGWDKALFFFIYINKNYENIWFIEDDIFIYDENTLRTIDEKNPVADIICNSSFEEAKLDEWLWNWIRVEFQPPYYCGMMCACRMGRKMLDALKDYSIRHKTLFFLEACFPIIAKKYDLQYANPEEIKTVTHRNQFAIEEFNRTNIFHPAKDIILNEKIREHIHI